MFLLGSLGAPHYPVAVRAYDAFLVDTACLGKVDLKSIIDSFLALVDGQPRDGDAQVSVSLSLRNLCLSN